MPLEESVTTGGNTGLTRNFVGARGIEAMLLTQNGATTTSYPLYDVHGNMVATVAKNAAGTSWTIQDERSYDVWGSVRSGSAPGGPRGRYCANLGHVQDDESGLVYMRARYYEPGSGRFVSEDPAKDGLNFYAYGFSNPVNRVDSTGRYSEVQNSVANGGSVLPLLGMSLACVAGLMLAGGAPSSIIGVAALSVVLIGLGASMYGGALDKDPDADRVLIKVTLTGGASAAIAAALIGFTPMIERMVAMGKWASNSAALAAVAGLSAQLLISMGYLMSISIDESSR